MSEDELQITTADMLEIVAGGGNGVEYVDVCSLIEKAAKELREKDEEISNLREALKPFSDAASTDDYIDDIEIAETDKARKITFGDLRRARALLDGENKMPFYAFDETTRLRDKNKRLREGLVRFIESAERIRHSHDAMGYKDDERALVENEKLEKIALAVEKG